MEINILNEISNCVNKLIITLKEFRKTEVKLILGIPCWILDIQFFYFSLSCHLKLERANKL